MENDVDDNKAVTSYGGHIFMESICGYDVP